MKKIVLGFLWILTSPLLAQNLYVQGKQIYSIHLTQKSSIQQYSSAEKKISLLNIHLSPKAQHILEHRIKQLSTNNSEPCLSSKKQLGMNGVPVLDQGMHGTCVTFAVTAALDALLAKGDHISQLCLLQLGNYLQKQGYMPSGWEGSTAVLILSQLERFGYMSQRDQKKYGCGGIKYYFFASESGEEMPIEDYRNYSQNIGFDDINWLTIADQHNLFEDQIDTAVILDSVKTALSRKNRVVFGVFLPEPSPNAWYAIPYDTWVLTPEIRHKLHAKTELPGHEMIITGYDDKAYVTDSSGKRHYGILTLRNSWGWYVGHWGDFYMSYDYFKALVIEAYEIVKED